jgi:DNA-binding NarL/FixJ family response regulator
MGITNAKTSLRCAMEEPRKRNSTTSRAETKLTQSTSADSCATKTPGPHKIMLVDDHPMTRLGLAELFATQPDLQLCCEAAEPESAIREMQRCPPDLLILDIGLPGRGGLELMKDVHAVYPKMPVLIYSMHDESLYAERALRDGARGYVMKSAGATVILQAIRHILEGHVFLSPIMSQKVFSIFAGQPQHGSPIESLTDRELEVLEKIGQGQNTRQIAKELRLSPKTIESHRGNIKMKLNCPDTTSLLRFAVCWVEEN